MTRMASRATSTHRSAASCSRRRRTWIQRIATASRSCAVAAVGPMQFEVAVHRLENEFGAPVELSPTTYRVARRTDVASTPTLRSMTGVTVLEKTDGTRLALFESPYWLQRVESEQPALVLER